MALKRIRNAQNQYGAVEIGNNGVVKISSFVDNGSKLRFDFSSVPDATEVTISHSLDVLAAETRANDNSTTKFNYAMRSDAEGKKRIGSCCLDRLVNSYIELQNSITYLPTTGCSIFLQVTLGDSDDNIFVLQQQGYSRTLSTTAENTLIYTASLDADTTLTTTIVDRATPLNICIIETATQFTMYVNDVEVDSAVPLSYSLTDNPMSANQISMKDTFCYSRFLIYNYGLTRDQVNKLSLGMHVANADLGGIAKNLLIPTQAWEPVGFDIGDSFDTPAQLNSWSAIVTNGADVLQKNIKGNLVQGQQYLLSYTATIPTGIHVRAYITSADGVTSISTQSNSLSSGNGSVSVLIDSLDSKTWTSYGIKFYIYGSSADLITISNMKLIRPGATLALEPENLLQDLWLDSSANGHNAKIILQNKLVGVPPTMPYNRIINGSFDYWERRYYTENPSITLTNTTPTYIADRWMFTGNGAVVSRILNTDNITNARYVLNAWQNATNPLKITTRLPQHKCKDLVGKACTLSFWASNLAGSDIPFDVSVNTAYVSNNFDVTPVHVVFAEVVPANTDWKFVSITIPALPATAANGIEINIYRVAGTGGGGIKLASVMLNEGLLALPFNISDSTPKGELEQCRQFYENFGILNVSTMVNEPIEVGTYWLATTHRCSVPKLLPSPVATINSGGSGATALKPTIGNVSMSFPGDPNPPVVAASAAYVYAVEQDIIVKCTNATAFRGASYGLEVEKEL